MQATATIDWEHLNKLSRDLVDASKLIGRSEARYFVDFYYQVQDFRIASAGQVRSAEEEPSAVLQWFFDQMRMIEHNLKRALDAFTKEHTIGVWLQSICGVGPVIAAGLMAHLDIRGCPTAGHFWRFAGLAPEVKWEKKTRRPWNAKLKTLCWKAGESFVKVQSNDKDFYGQLFATRKSNEWEKNLAGKFAGEAARALEGKKFNNTTLAYKFYSGQISPKAVGLLLESGRAVPPDMKPTSLGDETPMLPPAHIHARARRYAVKLFLSHVHHAMYLDYYGDEPPRPYIFDKHPEAALHSHYIAPPNLPFEVIGKSLRDLLGPEAKREE